ncbi:MAG: cadherin-like domain-containing protein, partial [Burkholderiaceae bacterium]
TVTDINEGPSLFNLGGDFQSVGNNGSLVTVDVGASAQWLDPEGVAAFDGGSLVVTGSGFDGSDALAIDTTGAVTLSAGYTNGSIIRVGGIDVGTLAGVSAAGFSVSLGAGATTTRLDAVLASVQFQSTSTSFGLRTVAFVADDGDGGSSTGPAATAQLLVVDASGGQVTLAEDGQHIFSAADFGFTGYTGASIQSITVTALPGAGSLTLNSLPVSVNQQISRGDIDLGLLRFDPVPDANGSPYTSFSFYINGGVESVTVLNGEPSSFTLNGGFLAPTDAILANAANFGPGGVIDNTISVAATSTTIDAAYLAQGLVLFDGETLDSSYTAAELAAIDTWVNAGGILISTNENTSYDPISESYTLPIVGNGSTSFLVANNVHPVMNGPFGSVGPVGGSFAAAGAIGYFDAAALQPGDIRLANDSLSGQPTIVLRPVGSGFILFTSDEGIFRAGMTGDGTISTPNDILVANVFAWASSVANTSVTTHPIDINVTPVDDAPTLGLNTGTSVNEGATVVINNTMLRIDDVDTLSANRVYTVSALPANGSLRLSTAVLGIGGTFTQDDIDNNRVDYLHNDSETNADSLQLTFGDATTTGLGPVTFNLTVNPVNDND